MRRPAKRKARRLHLNQALEAKQPSPDIRQERKGYYKGRTTYPNMLEQVLGNSKSMVCGYRSQGR